MINLEFGPEWSAGFRRGTEAELRSWLTVALACCDRADERAIKGFRRGLEIEQKVDRTYVTEVDRAIERETREHIGAAFPSHGIVGEEEGAESPDASVRWYIDPIDGTHNYIRGIPLFGTLLAVERDGELQVGVMSAPALGQRWVAWRGGGAWNNDGRLHVSDVTQLEHAGNERSAVLQRPATDDSGVSQVCREKADKRNRPPSAMTSDIGPRPSWVGCQRVKPMRH